MENRDIKSPEPVRYFNPVVEEEYTEKGTREILPLAPFIISGGENTERYYFIHVNALSKQYKFNIRPEYFGDESAYTETFPQRIKEILNKNADARVFCVFDMDTVVKYKLQAKHKDFVHSLKAELDSGQVILCDSMPSFEFWLLLHFVDYKGLLKDFPEISQVLAPYIKPYFSWPHVRLKKLLKSKKYLENSDWVRRLLEENRLEQAIQRAKICSKLRAEEEKEMYSYSNVFKAFI